LAGDVTSSLADERVGALAAVGVAGRGAAASLRFAASRSASSWEGGWGSAMKSGVGSTFFNRPSKNRAAFPRPREGGAADPDRSLTVARQQAKSTIGRSRPRRRGPRHPSETGSLGAGMVAS
jgi:hypothetical protein